jgi:hypothetical protein
MSFLRPYRVRSILLHPIYRPVPQFALRARFASGYGDPSDDAHPATANPQEQGSSTQQKQAEHPGPRENEPDKQGGSSYGDKGQKTKADAPPTDTKSSERAADISWQGNGSNSEGGSRVHGSEKKETRLGGSLSMNKDKGTDPPKESGVGGDEPPLEGDMAKMGKTDGKDARDVGGKDDTRKQS